MSDTSSAYEVVTTTTCGGPNDYDGYLGVRVSAIFVILVSGSLGAFFPLVTRKSTGGIGIPEWLFLACKYFGSGVILATSFIHLLDPALESLEYNDCLEGTYWTEYPFAMGICLFTIATIFFSEFMVHRYADLDKFATDGFADKNKVKFQPHVHDYKENQSETNIDQNEENTPTIPYADCCDEKDQSNDNKKDGDDQSNNHNLTESNSLENGFNDTDNNPNFVESKGRFTQQLAGVFIFEFGVIFHSVFVGLTLAVAAWDDFRVLYVVIVFHQGFEGLGLGTRLAEIPWAKSKRWTPYFMALSYGLTTPIAIAIGVGVRYSYNDSAYKATISSGVFDSVSAGILIYTSFVELLAHDFLFDNYFATRHIKYFLWAFWWFAWGAGLMALLGKWA